MRKIINLFDKYEVTKKIGAFVVAFVTLSSLLFMFQPDGSKTPNLVNINIFKEIIFKMYLLFVFSLLVIFLLETLQIFVGPRIHLVSSFIKPILEFITAMISRIFNVLYVRPLSFLIGPSVKRLLENFGCSSIEREFV